MSNISELIYNFLKDKSISISRRMGITISVIILIFFVNDHYGFFFHYQTKKKIEIINIIEDTKTKVAKDSDLYIYLDDIETNIINRKSKLEVFFDKVVGIDFAKIRIVHINNQDTIIQLITSTGILLLFAFVVLILIFIYLFRKEKDKWSVFAGGLVFLLIIGGLIGLIQFLWSLVPTLGHKWINYSLQLIIQVIFSYRMVKLSKKNKAMI